MNGVISASVSIGSSHRVASVTWTPIVIVPLGSAAAGATARARRVAKTARARSARIMWRLLPRGRAVRVDSSANPTPEVGHDPALAIADRARLPDPLARAGRRAGARAGAAALRR